MNIRPQQEVPPPNITGKVGGVTDITLGLGKVAIPAGHTCAGVAKVGIFGTGNRCTNLTAHIAFRIARIFRRVVRQLGIKKQVGNPITIIFERLFQPDIRGQPIADNIHFAVIVFRRFKFLRIRRVHKLCG